MRAQITEEQEQARAEQAQKDADESWRRRQIKDAIQANLIWLVVLLVVGLEVLGVLWEILLHQQNGLPSWPGLRS